MARRRQCFFSEKLQICDGSLVGHPAQGGNAWALFGTGARRSILNPSSKVGLTNPKQARGSGLLAQTYGTPKGPGPKLGQCNWHVPTSRAYGLGVNVVMGDGGVRNRFFPG